MVLDVIDNNYLASHKYSYIWKWFLIIVLIVYLLDSFNIIKLSETQDTIFSFVVILVMLALLVNQFLFTRIGKLELIENIIITRINDSIQTIELDAIKTVKVSNTNKNQYYLKFDSGFDVLIEMKNGQFDEIKQVFIKNKIKIIDTRIISKLKKWFTKQ